MDNLCLFSFTCLFGWLGGRGKLYDMIAEMCIWCMIIVIESVLVHTQVDPADISESTVWVLEDSCWGAVSCVLFVVHYYRDVSVFSSCGVESWPGSLVLGHDGVLVQAPLAINDPVNVPSRNDTRVFGGAREYGPVLAIPGTT